MRQGAPGSFKRVLGGVACNSDIPTPMTVLLALGPGLHDVAALDVPG